MRTIAILALALGALSPITAPAQPRNNDYYMSRGSGLLYNVEKYHLALAEEEIGQKRYQAAYNDLIFILNYYPNHPKALQLMEKNCALWKSLVHCEMDDYFKKGIARNPDIAATHTLYGIYLLRVKKPAAAIQLLERAVTLDPKSINAQYNLALAYLDDKQYEQANAHAQVAYGLGAPLGGLKDRLQRVGAWRPSAASAPSEPSAAAPEKASAR